MQSVSELLGASRPQAQASPPDALSNCCHHSGGWEPFLGVEDGKLNPLQPHDRHPLLRLPSFVHVPSYASSSYQLTITLRSSPHCLKRVTMSIRKNLNTC